jgi:outer membrane receptor protein involved in Fe transport
LVAFAGLNTLAVPAHSQTPLPEIRVSPEKQTPKRSATSKPTPKRSAASKPTPQPSSLSQAAPAEGAGEVAAKNREFNETRDTVILPKIGTNTYDVSHEAIEAMPQGTNARVGTVLLQAPGVSQDTGASFEGPVHVRLEHGALQYRINGILLPEGVTAFGQLLETGFIGNLTLVTGALPAQYGFRSSGLVDITTRSGGPEPSGKVSVYGGSRETITPSFEYGGTVGKTEYFFTGRYFGSSEGIENPIASLNAIHDHTAQQGSFGYTSTLLDDTTRLSTITGSFVGKFQIPNTPGRVPSFTAFGVSSFDSSLLNENQYEQNYYGVVALQKDLSNADMQLAYFTRYSTVHFIPDTIGDVIFNGVASNVYRQGYVNGIQGDNAVHLNDAHTLRVGFITSAEDTKVVNAQVVLPVDEMGNPFDAPFGIVDAHDRVGLLLGTYAQDEWRITNALTLNAGLRYEQWDQWVHADQLSPRVSLVYKALEDTTVHASYARYFTPPSPALSAPITLGLFTSVPNTQTPAIPQDSLVVPERSHYFDVGVVRKVLPGLEIGLDGYYKIARDQIDVGQFGPALVLNEFNYAKGYNEGVELKVNYHEGNFKAYGNLAWARQFGTDIVSNQLLFDPALLAYVATHWINTDLSQTGTGSAGVSYLWQGTRFSADMIYGTGLRGGFANTETQPPYVQFNLGVSHEFESPTPDTKPITLRFDVVNVFDTIYQLRNGTGIGVFSSQFGPRRGYFVGISQKL